MKKLNKTQFSLFLPVFIIIAALSISAYYGGFKKEPTKVNQTISTIKPLDGGGPIKLATSLDNSYYYDNDNLYLYIDLKADKVGEDKERAPLNIGVVIDKSGSMADKNKLDYVKKAVDYVIDQLEADDYISIVTYDDYVDVLQRSAVIRDKYDLRDKVSKLRAGGFTNLSGGMFEGYDQVNGSYMRGYVNRVLLLSDGLANRGVTDRFELSDIVRNKNRSDGITISTFGVGNDFNENLMADIADYGKGNYYYIRNSYDIPEIFASELKGVRNLVGQGTKLKIKFPSRYISLNKVFGYPYEITGDEIVIDFKDVFSEQSKGVLLKFDVKRKIDSRLKFESELTYEDVTTDFRQVSQKSENSIEPAGNKYEYDKNRNESVVQNISVFEANDMMENALKEADNGNYEQARNLLKDARGYMDKQMGEVAPSPEMKRQSDNIDRYGTDLESAETKSEEEKKEMQKSGKYDNYNARKK
ncbi:MAG: VWA domain-containing protein [Chlorobi bacterium]|nr:VWA domain-containing protein [Chlorobiota bacterium]MCI0715717.1 VWA domain-containing protein [Chlorobiota bacterium]